MFKKSVVDAMHHCINYFVRSPERDAIKNPRRDVNKFLGRSAGRLVPIKALMLEYVLCQRFSFLDLSFRQEPRNDCRSVPERKCTQVTVMKMKACSYLFLQVLKEVCKDVPKEHCEYLPKLVAKKKCEKQKKFVDKLKDMVKW